MKKIKFATSTLIFLIISINIFAQKSLNKGLVAYYPFNGNVEDASGNQNHGFMFGGVSLTQDRFSNDCSAMYFNGQDGYISIDSSPSLESPNQNLSIAGWFRLSQGSKFSELQWVNICCKSNIREERANSPHYRLQTTKVTSSINTDFTEELRHKLDFDKWYFYTTTFDGQTVRMYLNGENIFEFPYDKPLEGNRMPLEIGRDMPGVEEYFCGSLDDIRIYNRTLSIKEIQTLYKDNSEKNKKKSPCPQEDDIVNVPQNNQPQLQTPPNNDPNVVKVKSKHITLYFYDHEEKDGDIVSINFNGVWVVEKYKLKLKSKTLSKNKHVKLTLEPRKRYTLMSKAWNEGSIPPNTLTVEVHGKRGKPQIFQINSTPNKSGTVDLIYEP